MLDDLITTIFDDFAKYPGKAPASRLDEVFRSIAMQPGAKFKHSKVSPELGSAQGRQALELLLAGITALEWFLYMPCGCCVNAMGCNVETREEKEKL